MKFSKSQLEAIQHLDGPCLVLAVPGSGKTTVLLSRINNLIENGAEPDSILSMTFSKAQALDMENRYKKIYGNGNVKFSTIHSFAYGIVRAFNRNAVNLIESSNEYNKYYIVNQIYYSKKKRRINDEQLESFFRVSGFLKNTLMDYEDYEKMYGKVFNGFKEVYNLYENFKKERNLIDFDDMLILALKIIQEDERALNFLQKRFKYVQIDEGQDTSYIQLKIISLIASKFNNLFIVADDDQSIYGFRGASSKQLLDFKNVYPDAKLIYMQDNFRSTKNIIDISNRLIKNNLKRYKKIIIANHEKGEIVNLNKAKNTISQTNHVLDMVKKDLERGENAAILYRNNISSINIINAIPNDMNFYIKDFKKAFFENRIIKDLIDTINFSKDLYDLNTFKRIFYKFNLFLRRDFVNQVELMPSHENIIEKLKKVDGMNNFFLEKIFLLEFNLEKLADMNFYDAINFIIYSMDYYEYLKEFARRNSMSMISIDRIIDTLLNISKDLKTVRDYENKVDEIITKAKNANKNKLTLSTIHGAKGLEFDNVYIIDLVENEFPSSYSKSQDELGVLEEERRLFYVGITRAKKRIHLYYPEKLYLNEVDKSSFIDEILKSEK